MTWTGCDAGDVRARAIDDTTPRTADRRVETGGSGPRQHGVLMAAGATTVGGWR
jgi:hypothetical protein